MNTTIWVGLGLLAPLALELLREAYVLAKKNPAKFREHAEEVLGAIILISAVGGVFSLIVGIVNAFKHGG